MPSGWEEHPEYAGPAPTWYGILAIVLFFCALAGLAAYLGAR